jgi:hypothetical protein
MQILWWPVQPHEPNKLVGMLHLLPYYCCMHTAKHTCHQYMQPACQLYDLMISQLLLSRQQTQLTESWKPVLPKTVFNALSWALDTGTHSQTALQIGFSNLSPKHASTQECNQLTALIISPFSGIGLIYQQLFSRLLYILDSWTF